MRLVAPAGSPGADGGVDFVDAGTGFSSCVTSSNAAELAPVNLVFMFDQSGSMGDEAHGAIFGISKKDRWDPITNGLKRFFADGGSAGMRASLQYFPADQGWCSAQTYRTPEVPLTALPNATPFVNSINKHAPLGGTPTLPAIAGAILYAKDLQAQFPTENTAVVLVTDGEPSDCGEFDQVVAEMATNASAVKTYVVGVGKDLTRLADLAKAGGTGSAILIDLKNPQQSSDDFLSALSTIRGKALSCTLAIPPAPAGKTLDPKLVNVALSSPNAPPDVLTYDAACTDAGSGWRYDNLAAPTSIELCPASCERARILAGGAIDVQLGCATKGLR